MRGQNIHLLLLVLCGEFNCDNCLLGSGDTFYAEIREGGVLFDVLLGRIGWCGDCAVFVCVDAVVDLGVWGICYCTGERVLV